MDDVTRLPMLFGPGGRWVDYWPSEPSARYYVRQHRAELAQARAIVRYLGRWRYRDVELRRAIEAIATRETERAVAPACS